MISGNQAKVTAASLGLSGFAIALIAGVAVDNPLDATLARGLGAMASCFVVGYIVGLMGEHVFMSRLVELRDAQRPRVPGPVQPPAAHALPGPTASITPAGAAKRAA